MARSTAIGRLSVRYSEGSCAWLSTGCEERLLSRPADLQVEIFYLWKGLAYHQTRVVKCFIDAGCASCAGYGSWLLWLSGRSSEVCGGSFWQGGPVHLSDMSADEAKKHAVRHLIQKDA
jgi:hypothetical protein